MEVSGQLHAPAALPPGKEPLVSIGYEAGWTPRAGLDMVVLGLEPLIIQPVAQCYTTEPFQLLFTLYESHRIAYCV
jgi:hypothetical protein